MDDIRIRPHHLSLCLMTYAGYGYTASFTGNLDGVVARINAGMPVRLIEGPDDVCAGLRIDHPREKGVRLHCDGTLIAARDEMALADINRSIGEEWKIGQKIALTGPMVAQMRQSFATGETRDACEGCQWHDVCTEIAARDFKNTKLHPPLVQIAAAHPVDAVNDGPPACVTGYLSIRRQPLVSRDV